MWTPSKGRYLKDQYASQRVFNKISQQGDAKETPTRCNFASTRIANIIFSENTKCSQECGVSKNPIHCSWIYKTLWENILPLLVKLNMYLPYDPIIPPLGIYPMET